MATTRYVDPVPNATARNWGGAQGRAAGMKGSLPSTNVGADYLAAYGSPLYAPIGGNIVQVIRSQYTGTETDPTIRQRAVNENHGWGTSVIIQGDDGFYHRLSHMVPNSPTVKQGDRIDAGQQIGAVGQSGNTKGSGKAGGAPHLDWEKFKAPDGNFLSGNRQYVDPRLGDFEEGRQAYVASSPKRTYQEDQTAGNTLNRGAGAPAAMQQWLGLIEEKAAKYGVPPQLLAGIVEYESGGDPNAQNKSSGATGLGQVMPKGSGQWFGDRPTAEELKDPETNLEWSAKILGANYKRYNGNPQSAAAAYLGAVDAKGNPTTAADANGTNGFKYIQEVMSRSEKYTSSEPDRGGTSNVAAQQAAQERKMAESTKDMIDSYNETRKEIDKRVTATQADADAKKAEYNKALARQAELQAMFQAGKIVPDSKEDQEFGRASLNLPNLQKAAEAAEALAKDARTDRETNDAALSKSLEIAAGKVLNPEEKDQLKASAAHAQGQADLAKAQAALIQEGQPGYQEAQAKAKLAQAQADNYKRTIDIDQQRANATTMTAETGRFGAQTDRMKAETDIWATRETTPANIERLLASAGLDSAQAANVWARIKPGIADLEADTRLKGDQGAYQRAMTERVNKLAGAELSKLVGEGKLIQAQADKAIATLPYEVAQAAQTVRQTQAQTGLLQGQTWAQMVEANTKQFEAEMKSREAEVWQQVQKIASNPNASDEDIMGAIQAGAKNATEAAQVYQTRINQYQQQEASRHNKVDESVAIQNADEVERNNRYQNLAGIQNARANMQNASTNAIGPRLGATGMANAMAGLGMVTGSAGLNRLAMQSGTGASVINPVKEGLAPFEKDQETLRAGVRDNRLANPNAEGTKFAPPRATGATAGIGSAPIPKLNSMSAPQIEGVNFKPPGFEASTPEPERAMQTFGPPPETPAPPPPDIPAPAPAPEPEPIPAPPPPEEEEEEGGGGKRPGGNVKVVYSFKPPKAGAKKSTSVAAAKPRKTRLGKGGGFRVPGRIAA